VSAVDSAWLQLSLGHGLNARALAAALAGALMIDEHSTKQAGMDVVHHQWRVHATGTPHGRVGGPLAQALLARAGALLGAPLSSPWVVTCANLWALRPPSGAGVSCLAVPHHALHLTPLLRHLASAEAQVDIDVEAEALALVLAVCAGLMPRPTSTVEHAVVGVDGATQVTVWRCQLPALPSHPHHTTYLEGWYVHARVPVHTPRHTVVDVLRAAGADVQQCTVVHDELRGVSFHQLDLMVSENALSKVLKALEQQHAEGARVLQAREFRFPRQPATTSM
jgi:hypothetical protein